MNNASKLLVAGVAGAAVGAAAALLLAPDKGSETRKKLMSKVKSAKSSLDGLVGKGEEKLTDFVNKGKQTAKEA